MKRSSIVIIYQRGNSYYCDATGCFGGGYSGAFAGGTPEEAAIFAIRAESRYIDVNPLGGKLIMPIEVREALAKITTTV